MSAEHNTFFVLEETIFGNIFFLRGCRENLFLISDFFWKNFMVLSCLGRKTNRSCNITINSPLILKMREIIFFLRANYKMGHFKGYFEGSKKSRPPRNIPRNGPLCSLPKTKKIMSLIFKISGALVLLCLFATRARICKRLRIPKNVPFAFLLYKWLMLYLTV